MACVCGITPAVNAVYDGGDGGWTIRVQFDLHDPILQHIKIDETGAGECCISKVARQCLTSSVGILEFLLEI